MIHFEIQGQSFLLLPQKAIYWKEQQALLLADTHFGKVTHFRKSGIPIPGKAAYKNILCLEELLQKIRPRQVIFLGDLFHSEMNTEWLIFKEVLRSYSRIHFKLIQGNHDILHDISYVNSRFTVYREPLSLGPFLFTHEPQENPELYNLCGHIHPGVTMTGPARQFHRFPCFFFGEKNGILPAFGEFTGLHILQPQKADRVFVITKNEVIDTR